MNNITFTLLVGNKTKRLVASVAEHAAKDDTRPTLKGIHIIGIKGESQVSLTATNGFTLGQNKAYTADSLDCDFSITVDAKRLLTAVTDLTRGRGNLTSQIGIVINDNTMQLSTFDSSITLPLIDGTYPDFQAVIPNHKAANSWSLAYMAKSNASNVPDAITIGLSPDTLMSLAKSVKAASQSADLSTVTLTLTSNAEPIKAGLFGDEGQYTAVIMPMHMRD